MADTASKPMRSRRLPPRKPPSKVFELRYQFIDRPCCPACESVDTRCEGTRPVDGEKDTIQQYTVCKACGQSWYVIAAPPARMPQSPAGEEIREKYSRLSNGRKNGKRAS